MKMVLLILVALMLSAQPAHDPAFIPGLYLTAGALNGYWWTHATEKERGIYLLAYGDGARISISAEANIYYDTRSDLKMRGKDVFESIFGRQIRLSRQRSCRDLGATPVASVSYRLASDTYCRLRCAD